MGAGRGRRRRSGRTGRSVPASSKARSGRGPPARHGDGPCHAAGRSGLHRPRQGPRRAPAPSRGASGARPRLAQARRGTRRRGWDGRSNRGRVGYPLAVRGTAEPVAHGRGQGASGAGRRGSSALLPIRVPDAGLRQLEHPYLTPRSTGRFRPPRRAAGPGAYRGRLRPGTAAGSTGPNRN